MNSLVRLIRCENGNNFRNLKKSIWGFSSKIKLLSGCVLVFITNTEDGKKIIGVAKVKTGIFFDIEEEPLIKINTYTNKEAGWEEDKIWRYQIELESIIDIEHLGLKHNYINRHSSPYYKKDFLTNYDIRETEYIPSWFKYINPKKFEQI